MSCNGPEKKCEKALSAAGVPEGGAAWSAGRRDGEHCPKCGGYLTDEGGCNQCQGGGMLRYTTGQKDGIKGGMSVAEFLTSYGVDPLNNPAVKRLHENYVSIVSGQERKVVLNPGCGTAGTDLKGTVELNPYPLGPNGSVADQLIVAREYIDHELGHELFTPEKLLTVTAGIAGNKPVPPRFDSSYSAVWQDAADLSDAERALLFNMVNVVEDARMERVIEAREPYMWKRMLAGQMLQPKDEHARNGGLKGMADYEQVLWATQIVGQSNYALTPDIKQGMTPEALRAINDLRPVIDRGVRGTALDALKSSVEIVRYLRREGMLPDSPQLEHQPPATTKGSKSADGEASAGSSQQQGDEQGDSGEQQGQGGKNAGQGDNDSGKQDNASGGGESSSQQKCPDCGGFLDKDGQCTQCGNKQPASDKPKDDSGGQGGSPDEGSGEGSEDDSGKQDGSSGGDEGKDDSGKQASSDNQSGQGGGAGSLRGDDSPPAGNDNRSDDGGGQTGDFGGKPGSRQDDDEADLEKQRKVEEQQREARKTLDEMRTAMDSEYNHAVKGLMTSLEKQVGKKAAERTGKSKSLPLTLPDYQGNPVKEAVTFYGYTQIPSRNYKTGGPGRQQQLVRQNANVIGKGATQLADRLKRLKQQVQRDAYLQKTGDLDRRRFTSAMKGSDRVRVQQAPRQDTSMAVSLLMDTSGSMSDYADDLGTIVGIMGKGMEIAQVPYEVRSFDQRQYHVKAFDDPKMSAEQLMTMYTAEGCNTLPTPSITAGGLALQTRPEAAKIQFVVTDGDPGVFHDNEYIPDQALLEVKQVISKNQAGGVVTMGIFFAGPSGKSREDVADKFDMMYGKTGWLYVEKIDDIPKEVTKQLEAQLKKLMPEFS